MGRKLGSLQECKDNFCNAVKYIWALRLSGASPKVTDTLTQYRVSRSYSPIVNSITGQETDVNALCEELYEKTRELNRQKNARAKAKAEADMVRAETPSDLFNPETLHKEAEKLLEHNVAEPQEIDIDRLRDRIRQEIYDELDNLEKEHQKAKREGIARRNLEILLAARPKEDATILATRAVKIADAFISAIDAE